MSGNTTGPDERLLTPSQVAEIFQVDPKTVTRWARKGKLKVVRTFGGHRRYLAEEVNAMAEAKYENDDEE